MNRRDFMWAVVNGVVGGAVGIAYAKSNPDIELKLERLLPINCDLDPSDPGAREEILVTAINPFGDQQVRIVATIRTVRGDIVERTGHSYKHHTAFVPMNPGEVLLGTYVELTTPFSSQPTILTNL